MSKIFIDPPAGWKYGFPKEAPPRGLTIQELEQWFLDNGYPQELIDKGMLQYCRFIFDED